MHVSMHVCVESCMSRVQVAEIYFIEYSLPFVTPANFTIHMASNLSISLGRKSQVGDLIYMYPWLSKR